MSDAQAGIGRQLSDQVIGRLKTFPPYLNRILIAIAGPPGVGKSTQAEALAKEMRSAGIQTAVLGMDGFHRSNDWLDARGLRKVKGAPETFDLDVFTRAVVRIKLPQDFTFPTFDRSNDRVVENGGFVAGDVRHVIVEGNYLLLNEPGWDALRAHWDLCVFMDADLAELERRLVDRWVTQGHSPEEAKKRAHSNDIPNMRRILARHLDCDLALKNGQLV